VESTYRDLTSPAAYQALREATDLLGPVPMLVVVIWEPGLPVELVAAPTP
jgi:hypothetical protein